MDQGETECRTCLRNQLLPYHAESDYDAHQYATLQTDFREILMKKHIQVIDDDPALVDILGQWLHMNGFEVTTANTCDYALSLPAALWQDINCIITGINQPGGNGRLAIH